MAAEPPENSQNTRIARLKCNAVTFKPSKRSIPELINDLANLSTIIDEHTARVELESRLFITRAAETSIDTLATALLNFSAQAPSLTPMHVDVIRAIAILLFKTDHDQKARNISNAICSLLEHPINKLSKLVDNNTNEENSNQNLNETIKKAEATINKLSTSMKMIKESVDQLAPTIKMIQNNLDETTNINSHLEKMQQEMVNLVKTTNQNTGYKTALLTGMNKDTNDQSICIAARDAIKARQLLINVAFDGPVAPGKVSHAQLVKKIKVALSSLTASYTLELNIHSVTQYCNGGTILEMMTSEAAEYLKKSNIKEEFIKNLDLKAVVKDRGYPVVIQFVPLTFNPDSKSQIQELEKENDWEHGTISSVRWIKPPNKCTNNQQVAHLMAVLKNPTNANEGI